MIEQNSQKHDSFPNHVDPLCYDDFLKYHLQLLIKSDLPNRTAINSKWKCRLRKITGLEREILWAFLGNQRKFLATVITWDPSLPMPDVLF